MEEQCRRHKHHRYTPGLYGFMQLKGIIERASHSATLPMVSRVNCLITLAITNGWKDLLTDRLLAMLGLDDRPGRVWLNAGTCSGDRPVNFVTRKVLWVYLEEINTTDNMADGAPCTLLTCVDVRYNSCRDVHTACVDNPEYKRLRNGLIGELKIMVRDEFGMLINNHNLPIYLKLEIVNVKH